MRSQEPMLPTWQLDCVTTSWVDRRTPGMTPVSMNQMSQKKVPRRRDTVGKIIDMATRGEIVAFLPTKTVDRGEALRLLAESISKCERLMALLERERPTEDRSAYAAFMRRLAPTLEECGERLRVTPNVTWLKIEGMTTGHRVYISKGKFAVNRVDSTLPPEVVPGAVTPTNRNGRIASWLPADAETVAYAIRLISAPKLP
jgi:hypothetical protein